MDFRPNLLERAFQLAKSGLYERRTEIIKALDREGFGNAQQGLHGKTLNRQLGDLMKASRAATSAREEEECEIG